MSNDLLIAALLAWIAAALISLSRGAPLLARALLVRRRVLGILAALAGAAGWHAVVTLPTAWPAQPSFPAERPRRSGCSVSGWCRRCLPARWRRRRTQGRAGWLFGAAMSLLGALGVFGVQRRRRFPPRLGDDELRRRGDDPERETRRRMPGAGAVHARAAGGRRGCATGRRRCCWRSPAHAFALRRLSSAAPAILPVPALAAIGVLLVIGFGAKLGLLPFYEWFPAAYGAGSGASGALMSGVVLNAAFFGLSRGLLEWAPGQHAALLPASASLSSSSRVLSAILTALYAFQQEDWRTLLSFSSAENAAIAVAMLGVALIFRGHGMPDLASLAWTVALLHLAGHALAKGGLFLTADGVYRATGGYAHRATPICCGAVPGCSAWERCSRR